jgi:CheY-like chemotaxis protein
MLLLHHLFSLPEYGLRVHVTKLPARAPASGSVDLPAPRFTGSSASAKSVNGARHASTKALAMSGADTTANVVPEIAAEDHGRHQRIVYVVDDNAAIRKSLHFALESGGFTVQSFERPVDFLENIAEREPAPILLDVRMPEINGFQLLQILRDRAIDWPVIMMTAHADIPLAATAHELGAIDFIEKPFAVDDLEERLVAAFSALNR